MKVPNKFPTLTTSPRRIAVVGDCPSIEDEKKGEPFVSPGGQLLENVFANYNMTRGQLFLGNICQVRPPMGNIDKFKWEGEEIQSGIAQLTADIMNYNPNIILALGNIPLKAVMDMGPVTQLRRMRNSIGDWRGSFLSGVEGGPFAGRKCIGTYHPAAALRIYEYVPCIRFDIGRCVQEAGSSTLELPRHNIIVDASYDQLMSKLEEFRINKPTLSIDIEGYVTCVKCIGFAWSPTDAIVVPFVNLDATAYWPLEQETNLWRAVAEVLGDTSIPKILQNSLYDNFCLSYGYKCPIRGVVHDTMLKHWELFAELEKSLAFQTSIYTKQPYYKFGRKSTNRSDFYRYCGTDCCVTYECSNVMEPKITGASRTHYDFNIKMLSPLLYIETRGIVYNSPAAFTRREGVRNEIASVQHLLNTLAGREMNTKSPEFKKYLYEDEKLPIQYADNGEGGKRPTTNYEALLRLRKLTKHSAVELALKLSRLRTRHQMLGIHADPDGRMRCGYNVVGTETGRLNCYTSPTGSGYNLQTIPDYDRDLLMADSGYHFFQCDLSGADGWTVAAHCAAVGDRTMLDDYNYGLKPAKLLALALKYGPHIMAERDRAKLKELSHEIKKGWQYFVCKQGQHGGNYLMGPLTLTRRIFIESDGEIDLTQKEAANIQQLYFLRYWGIKQWHAKTERLVTTTRRSCGASGRTRVYFGRKSELLGSCLANEPQENTTYATNMAMLSLWNDPENKREDGSLIIEPLHQVHDALCGQFPIERLEWATKRIYEYFNHTLKIAGCDIVIPFEGGYGKSWGELTNEL